MKSVIKFIQSYIKKNRGSTMYEIGDNHCRFRVGRKTYTVESIKRDYKIFVSCWNEGNMVEHCTNSKTTIEVLKLMFRTK